VASAVVELKSLVQSQMPGASHAGPSSAPLTIVERLAYRIDEIRHAQARACIVWLVGQYAADDSPNAVIEGVAPWAPDVLRKIAKSLRDEARCCHLFADQSSSANAFFSFFSFCFFYFAKTVPVKLQAVTLAAKLLVLSPAHDTLTRLANYVFALARYDRNYDVRDRGRMLQQLLAGVVPGIGAADAKDVGGVVLRRAQVRVVLFEGKEDTAAAAAAQDDNGDDGDGARRERERLGTLGLVLGRDVPNGRMLPDWLEHGVESSLRVSPDDAPATPAAVTAIGHVATPGPSSTSRAAGVVGSGGHSTPMVVLTPAGSGGPSPVGSVPNKSGWADLDKFYASDSEEEEEEEDEDGEEGGEEGDGDEDEDDGEDEESEDQSEQEKDRATGAPRTSEEKDDGEDEDEDEVSDVEQDASSKMGPVR